MMFGYGVKRKITLILKDGKALYVFPEQIENGNDYKRGLIAFDEGRTAEAYDCFCRAFTARRDGDSYFAALVSLLAMRECDTDSLERILDFGMKRNFADADYLRGMLDLHDGKPFKAFMNFSNGDMNGGSKARFMRGLCYLYGLGTESDTVKAVQCLKGCRGSVSAPSAALLEILSKSGKISESGFLNDSDDPYSVYIRTLLYGGDTKEALESVLNDVPSSYADCARAKYHNGDLDGAKELLNKGSELKDPRCEYALGEMYFYGFCGAKKDISKAKEYFDRAYRHGAIIPEEIICVLFGKY